MPRKNNIMPSTGKKSGKIGTPLAQAAMLPACVTGKPFSREARRTVPVTSRDRRAIAHSTAMKASLPSTGKKSGKIGTPLHKPR